MRLDQALDLYVTQLRADGRSEATSVAVRTHVTHGWHLDLGPLDAAKAFSRHTRDQ
jgi:hypothetical protein